MKSYANALDVIDTPNLMITFRYYAAPRPGVTARCASDLADALVRAMRDTREGRGPTLEGRAPTT